MNEPSYRLSPTEESFRSRGETQIARCLTRYHIPYFYEHPLAVLDEGKTRVWYPDFQLLVACFFCRMEHFKRSLDVSKFSPLADVTEGRGGYGVNRKADPGHARPDQ